MSDLLSTVAFLAGVGLLAWVGWGLEPHWASKDGRKFMCRMQSLAVDVHERAKWHDVKVAVEDEELIIFARSRRARTLRGSWTVVGASDDSKKKRRIYELRGRESETALLRVPSHSRSVTVLDRMIP